MMKKILPFVLLFCLPNNIIAQFDVNGNAASLGNDCYRLTPANMDQAGSIWNTQLINLNESFDLRFNINLGTLDNNGADGIAFSLQPIGTTIGADGGGLGIEGISPSLIVEFDTYQNIATAGDPAADHMALLKNGDLNHNSANNLDGPINISPINTNVEDGQDYAIRVLWNSSSQNISVYVNCQFRLNYTGDIVNDIFGGNPEVYWGFSAGTGSYYNIQQVCITNTFFNNTPDIGICVGESTPLNAGSGISYSWTPDDMTIDDATSATPIVSPTTTTVYSVVITDDCGIDITEQIKVVVSSVPTADLGADQEICMGETITLNAENVGYDYLWSTGQTGQTIDVDSPGIYAVTITNNDCIDTDEIEISFNNPPTSELIATANYCNGASVVLDAGGEGSSYLWSNGTTTQMNEVDTEGTYSVTITGSNGCTTTDMSVVSMIDVNVDLGNDESLCAGTSLELNAENVGSSYLWSNGETTQIIDVTTANTYGVTVTNENCVDTDEIEISFNNPPTSTLAITANYCNGASVVLDAGGEGNSYLWSNGTTTQINEVDTEGTYSVKITDSNGCTTTDMSVVSMIDVNVDLGNDELLCDGTNLELNAENEGSSYFWSNGETTQMIDVTTANTYSVTVTNEDCVDTDEIVITTEISPTVSLGEDVTICSKESATFTAIATNANNYTWLSGEMGNSITVNTAGNYSVEVSNECGTDADDVELIVELCDCIVVFPTAFSPNDDGHNDVFAPIAKCQFQSYDLMIFNRWGEVVFTSSTPNDSWDGKSTKECSLTETYVWILKYQGDNEQESSTTQGTLLLIH